MVGHAVRFKRQLLSRLLPRLPVRHRRRPDGVGVSTARAGTINLPDCMVGRSWCMVEVLPFCILVPILCDKLRAALLLTFADHRALLFFSFSPFSSLLSSLLSPLSSAHSSTSPHTIRVDDLIMDRTYHSLASQVDYDAMVTADLWITGMSVYLRGTIEEKIDFCFRVYDIDMNQEISRPVTTLCPPPPVFSPSLPLPPPPPPPSLSLSFFLSQDAIGVLSR